MERHRCKLCWRRFGSGRALGGHMRSHVMNPSMYTKIDDAPDQSDTGNWDNEMEMIEMEEEVDEGLVWVQDGSIIESAVSVHDRESESESSRRVLLTGRRSKRFRPASIMLPGFGCTTKKTSLVQCEAKLSESGTELEQGNSISDSTVEDVAFCLMMLSRDKWNTTTPPDEHEEEEVRVEHEVIDSEDDSTKPYKKRKLNRVESNKVVAEDKYKCETCSKTFTSYQALGGHKACSHNKVKATSNPLLEPKNPTRPLEPRIYQCPICRQVFPSGQALGGHKRSRANSAIYPCRERARSFKIWGHR